MVVFPSDPVGKLSDARLGLGDRNDLHNDHNNDRSES